MGENLQLAATVLSPEQIAQVVRLESIFMPRARAARERKRQHDNPGAAEAAGNRGRFCHYTSAENALKIINSKRLWMRSTTCMSDYREVQMGYDCLLHYFSDSARRDAFYAVVDAVVPGVAKQAIDLFDQFWRDISLKTHIVSVTEHFAEEDNLGRLSMWRAFATNSARAALVFSVPWYSPATFALGVMFNPVTYLSEAAAQNLPAEVMGNIAREAAFLRSLPPDEVKGWLFNMLLTATCCLKHEGFWEEREWRGVYSPIFGPSKLLEQSFEVLGGVPQKILKVPFDGAISPDLADLDLSKCLERVIIGPSQFSWVMYEAFVDALRRQGVPEPESRVWASNISLRD